MGRTENCQGYVQVVLFTLPSPYGLLAGYAIVVACHIWGESLQHKRIILNCDNESVVNVFNFKRSRVSRVMDLLRHLTLLTLKHNIYIRAKHIPGKYNEIADSLSRFQFQMFRLLAPQADAIPHKIPALLLKI